jgi:hydroxymethylbilane synthase
MIRIGSRGSKLALAQTAWVKEQILLHNPSAQVEVRIIRTSADIDTATSLRSTGTTGVFVKELEEAMGAGEIDLAVHSMKDLPTRLPPGLAVSAVPLRADARDALVCSKPAKDIQELEPCSVVGTGSLRRASQLLSVRPDLQIKDIRGNVDTRLAKLDRGEYGAIVLACAGLSRLGLSHRISCSLDISVMLPAPGQGALALETREDDVTLRETLSPLHHPPTAIAVAAERELLRCLGGGCNTPIGVYASLEGDLLRIDATALLPDGTKQVRDTIECPPVEFLDAAARLAESMMAKADDHLLSYYR